LEVLSRCVLLVKSKDRTRAGLNFRGSSLREFPVSLQNCQKN
jgi:hypothetical protein